MQALHDNWLPRITAEILGSLGRCPCGAVSSDREVLRGQHLSGNSSISLLSRLNWRWWAVIQLNVCVESKVIRKVEGPLL